MENRLTHHIVFSRGVPVIFITLTLDVLALGLVLPVLPGLIKDLVGGDASFGADVYGFVGTVWAVTQFIAAPGLGAFSDQVGRRPVIMLANLALGIDYVLMAMAPNLLWLVAGRVISGVAAGNFTASGAYIADMTPPERRAAGFGLQGAAFGIGFGLGPILGGLLGSLDLRLPFWMASGLVLINFCWIFFALPESLPPSQRRRFSWRRGNPLGALQVLGTRPGLFRLAVVMLMAFVAIDVLPSALALVTGYRFGWSSSRIGLTLGSIGLGIAVVQGGLVPLVVARFGERRSMLAGLLFGAVGLSVFGFAPVAEVLWFSAPLVAAWGLFAPAAQSLMSCAIGASEQARLQGAMHALHGISNLIAPALFTMTFAASIGLDMPARMAATPFLMASLLLAIALVFAHKWSKQPHPAEENGN